MTSTLSKAAATLGRQGGKAKVKKGFAKVSKAKRSAAAIKGNKARWGKAE